MDDHLINDHLDALDKAMSVNDFKRGCDLIDTFRFVHCWTYDKLAEAMGKRNHPLPEFEIFSENCDTYAECLC